MDIKLTTAGFADDIKMPDIEGLVDHVVGELYMRIALRTPVDTGNARDGWNVDGHEIINVVPYITALEYGHSQQAPAGMIRVSLEEIPQIIESYIEKPPNYSGKFKK